MSSLRRAAALVLVLGAVGFASSIPQFMPSANAVNGSGQADAALDTAITSFVSSQGGPPLVAAVVDRGQGPVIHSVGTSLVGSAIPAMLQDQMRLASVSKAFVGAVALSLVRDRVLSLKDTVARWLPSLPKNWGAVTLGELLNHTSGIPDFSDNKAFQTAVTASLLTAPPPADLLSYVAASPVRFKPGTRYEYSNSDNVIAALMVQAATGRPYESLLQDRVFGPFGLTHTTLPRDNGISSPFIHGYQLMPGTSPDDVTMTLASGWAWASGGLNSTPSDTNMFIREYARGAETDRQTRAVQLRRVARTDSSPPGPGKNTADLAIYEYQTRCGTVYGHTGNTVGYTQFVAATRDGSRSVVVTANSQITPQSDLKAFARLRRIYGLAVCAALANG